MLAGDLMRSSCRGPIPDADVTSAALTARAPGPWSVGSGASGGPNMPPETLQAPESRMATAAQMWSPAGLCWPLDAPGCGIPTDAVWVADSSFVNPGEAWQRCFVQVYLSARWPSRVKAHLSGQQKGDASISGLVAEYIIAIDVTRVRFPADASCLRLVTPFGTARQTESE
jgi:hypothetical protein